MQTAKLIEEERDTNRLSELLCAAIDTRASIAKLQAIEAATLAEAGRIAVAQSQRIPLGTTPDQAMPFRAVAAEFGVGLRISDRTAQADIDNAMTITSDFPETFNSWSAGRIFRTHVMAIMHAGVILTTPEAIAQFDRSIVPLAEKTTAGKVRKAAIAMVEKAQPRTMTERHREAREDRCVSITDLQDGMSELVAVIPAVLGHGIFDRITRQAKVLKDSACPREQTLTGTGIATASDTRLHSDGGGGTSFVPDARTIDQLRADLLADMLLTSTPTTEDLAGLPGDGAGGLGAIRATVQVTIPASTLSGTTETPGDMTGLTLVDPESARRLAGNAPGWDRVFTHPLTGGVLAVDRYRPSDHLKRYLRARDQHCRFPGCRMPVTHCDIDHTIDAALNGPTTASNLAHLCRRHHSMKHATAWRLTQGSDGALQWTSPTGRTYIDEPPGVTFEPDNLTPHPFEPDDDAPTALAPEPRRWLHREEHHYAGNR